MILMFPLRVGNGLFITIHVYKANPPATSTSARRMPIITLRRRSNFRRPFGEGVGVTVLGSVEGTDGVNAALSAFPLRDTLAAAFLDPPLFEPPEPPLPCDCEPLPELAIPAPSLIVLNNQKERLEHRVSTPHVEPTVRFELTACCLRNSCSTTELRRQPHPIISCPAFCCQACEGGQ